MKYGYLYQGQRYKWQKKRRGTPALDIHPAAFVTFIQNHDQIANSAYGKRCHALTSPGKLRAITALMLLAPGTPMLFQGQEFARLQPVPFFRRSQPRTRRANPPGPRRVSGAIPQPATPEMQERFADPGDPATFERCKLDHSERETHREIYDLHRDLLKLRREEPAFRAQKRARRGRRGALDEAFVLRFFGDAVETTGCCSSTSASICIWIRRRSRCSLRRPIREWDHSVVERRSQVWRHWNARRSTPTKTGEFPGTPPWC